IADCCAHAASGNVAAPPSSDMVRQRVQHRARQQAIDVCRRLFRVECDRAPFEASTNVLFFPKIPSGLGVAWSGGTFDSQIEMLEMALHAFSACSNRGQFRQAGKRLLATDASLELMSCRTGEFQRKLTLGAR